MQLQLIYVVRTNWPLKGTTWTCNNTIQLIIQTGLYQNGPKNFNAYKIVQNGPLRCPKWPIIQPKRPIAKSKMAHSYIQNGPLSLSVFGNVQSYLEILYVEASYTRVRGLDDSETVKCSAMHYGVTCSKFKSVNGSIVCKIATQHFPHHQSHVRLRNNIRLSTATLCRDYYIPSARREFDTVRLSTQHRMTM